MNTVPKSAAIDAGSESTVSDDRSTPSTDVIDAISSSIWPSRYAIPKFAFGPGRIIPTDG